MSERENASGGRLYQELARKLMEELVAGRYVVGSRLPAERDMCTIYGVSRPIVREAIIALEVQGFVETRIGSGAYVVRLPGHNDVPGFDMTAFELTEARLMVEGEVAALAATQATAEDLREISSLVDQIASENCDPLGKERADRAFHLAIARATRNRAMIDLVERLWDLREASPESALLHDKARTANVKPVVDEHTAVLAAIEAGDAAAARSAMRGHLASVLDSLLFATEEMAVEEARRATEAKRARYIRTN